METWKNGYCLYASHLRHVWSQKQGQPCWGLSWVPGSQCVERHWRVLQNSHHKLSLCSCLRFPLRVLWLNHCALMWGSSADMTDKTIAQVEVWCQVPLNKFLKPLRCLPFQGYFYLPHYQTGALAILPPLRHSSVATCAPPPLLSGKVCFSLTSIILLNTGLQYRVF